MKQYAIRSGANLKAGLHLLFLMQNRSTKRFLTYTQPLEQDSTSNTAHGIYVRYYCAIFSYKFLTRRARMALRTARTMTPTSAKMAAHISATPMAPRARQANLMTRANTMFW